MIDQWDNTHDKSFLSLLYSKGTLSEVNCIKKELASEARRQEVFSQYSSKSSSFVLFF